ncbi:DUF1003 domain-containing protein [Rhizobium oryzicola]|uniref:DUF1003 domain-containing protein n=1 Tax=Rhizobium oryzicola TaxID=1232668 RepID=A0ABT8T1X0_9HYPH|nr:DUF1003 domain-containing protein [Rhizobium oryzicola]MDO1584620.1 DUF1003 domain-containing protein [Rhizobium oryzicola]
MLDQSSPTYDPSPSGADAMTRTLDHNIAALLARRKRDTVEVSFQDKLADIITGFAGSMVFVYLHLAIFGVWILINVGILPLVKPFDPSLVVLAMVASVEAIFLSTFVLISQNRMAAADDKRADLNLQISLLHEHETTRLLALVAEMAQQMNIRTSLDAEIAELTRDVHPEKVMDKIEREKEAKL